MTTINFLDWRTLSGIVNELESPPAFFRGTAFTRERTYYTETIETHYLKNVVRTAPFVRRDAEAVQMRGRNWEHATQAFPNIRLKMPFSPNVFLDQRKPGTGIYLQRGSQAAKAFTDWLASEYEQMIEDKDTTIEWMCAKVLLDAGFTYLEEDEASFTITVPRHADMSFTNAAAWSGANDPSVDVTQVKRRMRKHGKCQPSMCILGEAASDRFMKNSKVKEELDRRNYEVGNLDRTTFYQDNGLRYLGRFDGIPFWEYMEEVEHQGVATQLVHTDKAYFIHTGARMKSEIAFGPIPEMQLIENGRWQRKIFTKSWREEDPSATIRLLHTRPVPWLKTPNVVATVTTA